MNTTERVNLSRRRFVIGASAGAAGLSIGMTIPLGMAAHHEGEPTEVNAWVVIGSDDSVLVRVARSEMGQGTLTGLVQMVAEELECDWDKVSWEFPTPTESLKRGRPWGSFSTGGSRGIRGSHQYVREGGAVARELLIAAAAADWSVPAGECTASNSVITHGASGRSVSFGAVAAKAATLKPPTEVTLKDPKDWKLIGKGVPRLDTAEKVTGNLRYGADLKLPGMLYATAMACPVHGGKRAGFDASKARSMPGVRAVLPVSDDAVAVVAESWWQAKTAMDAVNIDWEVGDQGAIDSAAIDAMLIEGLDSDETVFIGNERGDAKAAIAQADDTFSAEYSYPFQNHAPMEPMNATVIYNEGRCEAWAPTQNGEAALQALADGVGLLQEQCVVHKTILGGGFGRRGMQDWLVQTGLIAKQMPGTPIKLLWTREEDQRQGRYHPITRTRMTVTLKENGLPDAMHMRISGQSILDSLRAPLGEKQIDRATFQALAPEGDHAFIYGIEHFLADHAMRNTHLKPGFWRGVNINQNVFYLESFMDELAAKAGIDPLEYRRQLLQEASPLAWAVLENVAKRAGWGREMPAGHGLGLAVCKAFGSYVAACAEVAVEDGALNMKKIWAATDCGYAVNPQQIEAQVAGSFVYGLSAALYSEITVKDGAVQEENFNTYPSMKIAAMPEVETEVMASGGFWGGVGEPTIAVAAPAVLNAVNAATGVRIRHLPVKNQPLA
jgi:isoquinoline 1-oxidoreductase beta subunit